MCNDDSEESKKTVVIAIQHHTSTVGRKDQHVFLAVNDALEKNNLD